MTKTSEELQHLLDQCGQKLQASETRFRNIIEKNADAILIVDRDGFIQFANPAAAVLLGHPQETLIGAPFGFPVVIGEITEIDILGPKGIAAIAEMRVVSTEWEGEPAYLASLRDITDRKQAETRIRFQVHLLNTVEQAVIATDLAGCITYWNRFAEHLYGWPPSDAIGRNIVDVISARTTQQQAREIMKRLERGESWSGEFLVRHRNGHVFPILVTDSPIHDSEGTLIGIVGISHDITERKKAEKALQESEELHRITLSNISDAVFITDDAGAFTFICPNVDHIFGYTVQEVERLGNITKLFGESLFDASTLNALEEIPNIERSIVDKTGQRHALLITVKRVSIKTGTTLYTCHDITQHKQVEEENIHLLQQAQEDADIKSTLLHEVNHRVKNNLTSIIGLIYAEKRYARAEEDVVYRMVLEELAVRIQGMALVHTMLSNAEWAPLPLSELAEKIVHATSRMLPRRKQLLIDVNPSPITVTPGQANTLALVISELATNTVKYAFAEQERARITINISRDEMESILIEFHDDGPGYPEDVLTLARHNVGFHLISTLVCEDLGGEITLRNEQGAVACIRFKAS